MRFPTTRRGGWLGGAALTLAILAAMPAAAQEQARPFDIPAGDLGPALNAYARQADRQLMFTSDAVAGKRTSGLHGTYEPQAALDRLLAGSGLVVVSRQNGVLTLGVGGFQPARAAADPAEVSEVLVTAQKRSENIQNVPASISALSGSQLERLNATQLSDYAGYVPGFQVDSSGAPGLTQITLRGVTTGAVDSATVGVYVDDVPFGSSSSYLNFGALALDLMPYDIEQVEVLRGPQGTLYGASTLGGLLKYTTRTPQLNRFEARAGATLSTVEHSGEAGWGLRASINAPLGDTLALRVSGFREDKPGYIDNAATGGTDVNHGFQQGGRAALYWKPNADLSVTLTGMAQHTDYAALSTVLYDAAAQQPVYGDFVTSRLLPEGFEQTQQLYTATVNWDLGWATATSATGYSKSRSTITADGSASFLPVFGVLAGFSTLTDLEKLTQEVRLASPTGSRLEWLVGGFYTREHGQLHQVGLAYDPSSGAELPPPVNPLLDGLIPSKYEEVAVFGDATWRFTDAFDVSGGLRWARNNQSFQQITSGLLVGPPADVPGASSDDVVTYSLSSRYHFTPDVMVYGRIASGYRPGGPNLAIAGVPASFGPDTLVNYEIGLKSEFLDRRLLLDATVFHIDWRDIQTSASTPLNISFLTNAGKAVSDGLELTAELRPLAGLKLGGSFALIDARLSGDTPEANSVGGFDGDRLPLSPKTSAALNAEYSFPLTGDLGVRLGGSWRFVGARNSTFPHAPNDPGSANPNLIRLQSYEVLDLSAGVFNDRWSLSLFARNALNERAFISGGQTAVTVLQPRTIGVSLDTSF